MRPTHHRRSVAGMLLVSSCTPLFGHCLFNRHAYFLLVILLKSRIVHTDGFTVSYSTYPVLLMGEVSSTVILPLRGRVQDAKHLGGIFFLIYLLPLFDFPKTRALCGALNLVHHVWWFELLGVASLGWNILDHSLPKPRSLCHDYVDISSQVPRSSLWFAHGKKEGPCCRGPGVLHKPPT